MSVYAVPASDPGQPYPPAPLNAETPTTHGTDRVADRFGVRERAMASAALRVANLGLAGGKRDHRSDPSEAGKETPSSASAAIAASVAMDAARATSTSASS